MIKKFNEKFDEDQKKENVIYFNAIYNDIKEQGKDSIDEIFINLIDAGFSNSFTKFSDVITYTLRITIDINSEGPERRFKSRSRSNSNTSNKDYDLLLSNFDKGYKLANRYIQELSSCFEHLEYEYKDVSLFGNDFPIHSFSYVIDTKLNSNSMSSSDILKISSIDINFKLTLKLI